MKGYKTLMLDILKLSEIVSKRLKMSQDNRKLKRHMHARIVTLQRVFDLRACIISIKRQPHNVEVLKSWR